MALVLWIFASPRPAHAQTTGDLMEVFWQFRHGGVVNAMVDSRYDGQHFYLSLGDVFGVLNINLVQDPDAGTASGFYIEADRSYVLDFAAGRADIDGRTVAIDSSAFVPSEVGYYVRPDLLGDVFGMEITLNQRQLTMQLHAEETMPVVAAYERRSSRRIGNQPRYLQPNAPLLYGRRRALVDGAVMGYRLSASMRGTTPRVNASFRGGGEVLGGDFEGGLTTTYAPSTYGADPLQVDVNTWRWRYVVQDVPALTQVRAGELSSSGIRSFSYRGVAVSNHPVQVERFYGTYPLHVESRPDWEIELYLNNQLVDVQRADATGHHTFEVPITYGSTRITVREYGPNGEFEETERRLQIPFTFAREGQVRYNLYAGRSPYEGRDLVQGNVAVGLTRWLTAQLGFDYVTAATDRPTNTGTTRRPYGVFSARLGAPYILTAEIAPGALYQASFNANYPSLLSFGLDFTGYGDASIYSTTRDVHRTNARVSMPLRLGGLPMNIRTSITERKTGTGRYTYSLNQDVSLQPRGFQVGLGLRSNGTVLDGVHQTTTMQLETRLGMALPRSSWIPGPLQGLLSTVRSSYDLRRGQVQRTSVSLSRSLSRYLRLQTDVTHQFQTRSTTFNVRLGLNLSTVRTNSSASVRTGGEPSLSQDVSGAISYDAGSRRIELVEQNWVGRSAATMRLFVDYDGDGVRDEDEPYIEEGGVRFRRPVSTQQGSNGFIVAYNLLAYEQYNVEVDQDKIRNPLWVPQHEEFSFVTDPNSHKVIDIPFYVSGVVTGSVLREVGDALEPVPGMKLHIRQTDGSRTWTEPIFSDGSFYVMGLPPGEYEAYVDSSQVGMLKAESHPSVHPFTVEVTEMGDYVEGLDFVLRPEVPVPPAPATQEEPPSPAVQADADQTPTPEEDASPAAAPDSPGPADSPDAEAEATGQPAEQPDEPEAETYTVTAGDISLMGIARKFYDNPYLWPKIWVANRDQLPNPDRIEAGMQLRIPPEAPLTPEEEAAVEAYQQR